MIRIFPVWDRRIMSTSSGISDSEDSSKDQYEPIRKLAMVQVQPPRNPNKPFTSFSIKDILGANGASRPQHNNHHSHRPVNVRPIRLVAPLTRIVRPWDTSPSPGRDSGHSSDSDEEEINVEDDEPVHRTSNNNNKDVSPLDALMEMANKTFQGLETSEAADAKRREQAALFGKHQPPKKRRKSRTAFTNQQIYELEKRFLYQKYLTPADRDEIAQTLGLTNAQVITWFQNRRAKLKRDLEELKNDVVATKKVVESGSDVDIDILSDCAGGSICSPPACKRPRTPDSVCENSCNSVDQSVKEDNEVDQSQEDT